MDGDKSTSTTGTRRNLLPWRTHEAVGAFAVALLFFSSTPRLEARQIKPAYTSEEFLKPIKYLAGDELEGRGDGTPELDKAAGYLARRFKEYTLQPAGDHGSYLQRFTITVGAKLGP